MSDIAINTVELGKKYRIGYRENYLTLRDALVKVAKKPFSWVSRKKSNALDKKHIWALKDVSFEIKEGEIVGIIGRNGAGKSTLLRILSRITDPTEGYAEIYGRVGSLLEVGTGFHPELTGRENLYLSGAILGMKRLEINKKFDEIVSFAEIEKFIETPVKFYSSGMYVRLAFAVAAHLEPDILLVDEVLAVGDVAFQKKCLGAMKDLQGGGRTVLFVSHSMTAIENLCHRTIWLDNGKVKEDGPTNHVISNYLSESLTDDASVDLENFKDRSGTRDAQIIQIQFLNSDNQLCSTVRMGDRLITRFTIRSKIYRNQVILGMYLYTEDGIQVSSFKTTHTKSDPSMITGTVSFDLVIDSILLYPRTYMISPWITDSYGRDIDYVRYGAKFTVEESDFLGIGKRFDAQSGMIHIPSYWKQVEYIEIMK